MDQIKMGAFLKKLRKEKNSNTEMNKRLLVLTCPLGTMLSFH